MTTQIKSSRGKLYLLLLIFVVPMLVSSLLFFFHDHFQFKTTNHGHFINPPLHAEFMYSKSTTEAAKVWRVIHLGDGACDQQCEHINYQLTQMKKAFGKDSNRLQVLFINDKSIGAKLQETLTKQQITLTTANKIYLIDPLGNLFMYYADTSNPMDIFKDLKKVFGVSQIG